MQGSGEIITKDLRLIERFFFQLKSTINYLSCEKKLTSNSGYKEKPPFREK